MYACSTQEPSNPTAAKFVTTNPVTEITTTTAKCGGIQVNTALEMFIGQGIVWSTSPSPTIFDFAIIVDADNASFVCNLIELSPNTKYYVRAFIVNQNGVVYGNEVSFTTLLNTGTFTDARDGNVYNWVGIGNQIWMAENLKYLPSLASHATEISPQIASYYYVNGYDGTSVSEAKETANYNTYGVLYNWNAAKGACPTGWHLPSDAEWTEMENYLADNGHNYDGTTRGERAKIAKSLASTNGWLSSASIGTIGNTDSPSYRNKSGVSGLPGGFRYANGLVIDAGYYGGWWSATAGDSNQAWSRVLFYNLGDVYRGIYDKEVGFCIRCVKD